MKLYELLEGICKADITDCEIERILSDSRDSFDEKTLFVCIKGENFDAHTKAEEILQKGAAAVVVERDLGLDRQIVVKDTREALALIYANYYGNPQKKLTLIGVTGTNGKTTIATTIKNFFDDKGIKAGLIGTCGIEIAKRKWQGEINVSTTPEARELFEIFREMADEGCRYCVMEVSSQGLSQKRVCGCEYEVGIFTNLTQDHLDVHGDMESYYQAKKMLFDISKTAVINIDDSYGARLFSEASCQKTSYSLRDKADFAAENIHLAESGCEYELKADGESFDVKFPMPGEFNVANSAAVFAALTELGFDKGDIAIELSRSRGVCGRAEVISFGVDFTVIRDYAHTPDAVEKILKAVREVCRGRVICVFGCGGNRDAKKRPLMAAAAADYADFCVVTSDNPRNEEPEDIISDILVGFEGKDTPYIAITDRKEAIEWAIKNAKKDDIIAVVGKGHEDYQILKDGVKIHFDEKEVVGEILTRLFGV